MNTAIMADTFRIIDSRNVLFGIEGASQQHVLALLSARISQTTGLSAVRIRQSFEAKLPFGADASLNGVGLINTWLPEFGSLAWAAARLVDPVAFGDPACEPVDLVFAVVGSADSQLAGRRMARSFERLSHDPEAISALRTATSGSWFRAELTWALERANSPPPAMMRE